MSETQSLNQVRLVTVSRYESEIYCGETLTAYLQGIFWAPHTVVATDGVTELGRIRRLNDLRWEADVHVAGDDSDRLCDTYDTIEAAIIVVLRST